MSTAKAIAFTSSIPLVTVGTLELELHPFSGLPTARLRHY